MELTSISRSIKYVVSGASVFGIAWIVLWMVIKSAETETFVGILGGVLATIVGAVLGSLWWRRSAMPEQESIDTATYRAEHDQLTGLMNRSGLMKELEVSLEDAKRENMVLGVLFLDLDRFKVINDSMGHDTGDKLLQVVADRLRGSVRSTDLVARFGGDEFVIICRGLLSKESVVSVARQVIKNFAKPASLNGRNQTISTSIGVSIYTPEGDQTSEELVRDADTAMFKAKREKTGYAVFDTEQHQQNMEKLEIERGLTGALQENQFSVYYQPIVNVRTQKLYAFEALVRWNHPSRGMIGPGSFLDVAEEAGMLAKIGDIVLREACAQASVWNHIAPSAQEVKMSVNLSEQQLLDPNLNLHIDEVLAWAGLSPSQLILEITENVIVENLDSLEALRQLQALGVSLAIDDFGTGRSSLNSIKQLDMVSTLKVDQKFVRDMTSSAADKAIIEAVVAMAKALEMNIVAEGIEEEEQIQALQDLGVENMQGFFFSKPQAANTMNPQHWFQEQPSNN